MSENTENATASEQHAMAKEPAAKKANSHRGLIVTAVVVAVLVVAGTGMLVWHNSPSFCSTVCHTPMSKYVSDFETDSISGSSTAMLAAYHGADANMNCLGCHEATIDEQIAEGMSWMSGNYNFDSATQQLQSRSDEFTTAGFCLKSGCHGNVNTTDDLTVATADRAFNPHDWSQHGVIACGSCHKAHETSEFYCTQCHLESTYSSVPDGWNITIDGSAYKMEDGQLHEQ